jgi:hypothetical protein
MMRGKALCLRLISNILEGLPEEDLQAVYEYVGQFFRVEVEMKNMFELCEPNMLAALENELQKIMPSEESTVFFSCDFSEADCSLGIGLYVSAPLAHETAFKHDISVIFSTVWAKTPEHQRKQFSLCLSLFKGCAASFSTLETDFIPLAYTPETNTYGLHFRMITVKK